mmetsp:Transcript_29263/g.70414  ORF Transcript_29263/g.70414 Transcript_29263/m.70414 type:complete len:221 (-) Transcript_29263:9-671(-)
MYFAVESPPEGLCNPICPIMIASSAPAMISTTWVFLRLERRTDALARRKSPARIETLLPATELEYIMCAGFPFSRLSKSSSTVSWMTVDVCMISTISARTIQSSRYPSLSEAGRDSASACPSRSTTVGRHVFSDLSKKSLEELLRRGWVSPPDPKLRSMTALILRLSLRMSPCTSSSGSGPSGSCPIPLCTDVSRIASPILTLPPSPSPRAILLDPPPST